MNTLEVIKDGIIGNLSDLEEIQNITNARILIYSDSHGDAFVVKELITKLSKDCDALIFTGDGIFDLISVINLAKHDKKLKEKLPKVIFFVRGNGDASFINSEIGKLFVPSKLKEKIANKFFYIVHGNGSGVYYGTSLLEAEAETEECNVAVFGHTHVPFEELHNVYLVNPGSLSCPRRSSFKSAGIIEIIEKNINTIFYKVEDSITGINFIPYFPEKYN